MKRISLLFVLLALLIFGAACSSSDNENAEKSGNNNAEGESEVSAEDKVLTVAYSSPLPSTDPQGISASARRIVDANVFNRLFRRTADMGLEPELVEEYEMTDDTTLQATLIEGITFHNGDPVTAEDVKYSIERVALDETHVEYTFFKPITGVEVIDELTFEVTTEEPLPVLLDLLSKPASDILPKNYIEENGIEHFLENPIGSGPYQYVEWIKDDRVIMEPYEDYFEDVDLDWEEVIVRSIPEASTRVGELLTGNVQIIDEIPPNEWDRVDGAEGVSLVKGESSRVLMLVVRVDGEDSPLSDPKVREAIDLAINKEVLSEDVLQGSGIPVRSRSPKTIHGGHPDLTDVDLYDPEKAKELLAEAGYPDGFEIEFAAPTGGYLLIEEVTEMIVQMLGEVGITANLEQRTVNALIEDLQLGNNNGLSLIGYSHAYPDASYAMSSYYSGRGSKTTGYINEEFDELYEDVLSNLDDDERVQNLYKMQEIIAEDRPYIHLYQQLNDIGVSDSIEYEPRLDEQIYLPDVKRK